MKKPFWSRRFVRAPLWVLWGLLLAVGVVIVATWLVFAAVGWCADRLFPIVDAVGDTMDDVEAKLKGGRS